MFTAQQARELAGRSVQEKVESLLEAVKEKAKQKHRFLKTGWEYKADEDIWINGGYSHTEEWREAKKILEELGYQVDFFYEERQFVDMYTVIKW